MRILLVLVAALALCQCASAPRAGGRPVVIVGLAEAPDEAEPRYTMLWRKVNAEGRFADRGGQRMIEFTTHSRDTVRVAGIPGEFAVARVEPGTYALDGVFAELRERGLTYTAQGNIIGPERPAFEARRGEVIFLGIWQASVDGHLAVVRPWRIDEADLRAVARAANIDGPVQLRRSYTLAVPCSPRRIHPSLSRQIC